MRLSHLLLVAFVAGLAGGNAAAEDSSCRFRAERSGNADLEGIEKIVVRAGAGDLRITGSERAARLEARGRACASSENLLGKIGLRVRRDGKVAYVETELPQDPPAIALGAWYATLDLEVTLPARLAVDVQDSSGDTHIEQLASLSITDSSGDLTVRRIAGAVTVADSSGEIEVEDVQSLRLQDSSGDVEIRRVARDVEIVADGSGDLEIERVGGSVRVRQDSSGEIRIADVTGSAVIEVDSSGGITARKIGGDFTVGTDSGGGVDFADVQGQVRLP